MKRLLCGIGVLRQHAGTRDFGAEVDPGHVGCLCRDMASGPLLACPQALRGMAAVDAGEEAKSRGQGRPAAESAVVVVGCVAHSSESEVGVASASGQGWHG